VSVVARRPNPEDLKWRRRRGADEFRNRPRDRELGGRHAYRLSANKQVAVAKRQNLRESEQRMKMGAGGQDAGRRSLRRNHCASGFETLVGIDDVG
jgi:hypothetical protein